LEFCVLSVSVLVAIAPVLDSMIAASTTVVVKDTALELSLEFSTIEPALLSVIPPVAPIEPASVRLAPFVRLNVPAPSDTTPRLAMLLDAEPNVTFAPWVLRARVPAAIPADADCVIAEFCPIVVTVSPAFAVTPPKNARATLSARLSDPDPSDTTPKLAMLFDVELSETLPPWALKEKLPAVIAADADCVIPELTPIIDKLTDPLLLNAPATVRPTLSFRLRPPDPNVTTPRLAIVLDAEASVTSPFCVLNDNLPALTAPEPD
jgi:hypothetical protein